jgi:hypothetical protein
MDQPIFKALFGKTRLVYSKSMVEMQNPSLLSQLLK